MLVAGKLVHINIWVSSSFPTTQLVHTRHIVLTSTSVDYLQAGLRGAGMTPAAAPRMPLRVEDVGESRSTNTPLFRACP